MSPGPDRAPSGRSATLADHVNGTAEWARRSTAEDRAGGDAMHIGAPPFPRRPIAFTWWVARQFPLRSLALLCLTVLGTALQSMAPYAVAGLIAVLEAGRLEALDRWFAFLVVAWLLGPLIARAYTFLNAYTGPRMRVVVKNAMFAHVIRQSTGYFTDQFAGALVQRVRRAGMVTPLLVEDALQNFASVATSLLVAGILLFQASPSYAAGFAAFALVFLGATLFMARFALVRVRRMSKAMARVTGQLADSISHHDTVRSFAGWGQEEEALHPLSEAEYRGGRDLRVALALLRVVQLALAVGFMSLITWVVLADAAAGDAGVAEVALVLTVGVQVGLGITQLGDHLLNAFEHYGELKESLDTMAVPIVDPDLPQAVPLKVTRGAIRFDNVGFSYGDGRRVFENFDLMIEPGQRVGIVGRSGAGKTTLVKLLTRRYRPRTGRILIDGQDIAKVTLESLVQAVAEVPQSTELFHRTIADNLRYGRRDAFEEEVVRAADRAGADPFIRARPRAYGAVVGERGVKLSGGERQRVAVGRAILKAAPILVLDEATSALDTETEHAIQHALEPLMAGRTVIAIAHRLSTLRAMDRVIVLEDGRIAEEGPPDSLLAGNGPFRRAWEMQRSGFGEIDPVSGD